MRQHATLIAVGMIVTLAGMTGPLCAQTGETVPGSWDPGIPQARRAAELWKNIREVDRSKPEFREMWSELNQLIEGLRQDYRVPVAAAMMEWGSDDVINATALKSFGRDGLPLNDVREIVFNPQRSWKQRVLVRTYFNFLRPDYSTALSEKTRRRMLHMLAQRLVDVAGYDRVSYGEQRLLTHMLQAALSRYANQEEDVAELSEVKRAMRTYIAKKRPDDSLAVSIAAWLELADRPAFKIRTERDALLAMGHWDPLMSNAGTAVLQQMIRNDPSVGERVFMQFNDPRDEVRAAACQVFGQTLQYKPERIIPKLVDLLVNDRGVVVHRAASDALINHADQATQTVDLLADVFRTREPKPGPKRTESILVTLSHLVLENPRLDRVTKQKLLNLGMEKLDFAPQGALTLLEALGPFAKPAVPAIKAYRDNKADLYTRRMINRHTLMAIDPKAVGAGGD